MSAAGREATSRDAASRPVRLAIIISHPIQHFVHLYRCLASEESIQLRVFFCSDIGGRTYYDKDMGTAISWATDLLSDYEYVFLPESSRIHATTFFSVNNPGIASALNCFAPDVVILNGYAQLTMIRAMVWCRIRGIPTLMFSDSELLHRRAWYRRMLKQLILRMWMNQMGAFLTIGDNNEAYLQHYGVTKRKMFRSPYPFDEPAFLKAMEQRSDIRRSFRAAHGIDQTVVLAAFVGKLIPRKRPSDIVEALARHCFGDSEKPEICCMFAGNGELKTSLEERAQALGLPCRFLGFVNVDVLPHAYVAADMLIHPADSDAHPLATCEAAFVGLPLIVSNRVGSVGPTDTVRPGENAIVYPCGNVGALADAMARLARDPALRERMGEASLRIAAELDVRRSVQGILDAISFVTGRNIAPA